jgi:hypothetical protein
MDDIFKQLTANISIPEIVSPSSQYEAMNDRMLELVSQIKSPWEQQAEIYMEGLRKQVRDRESSLKTDEALAMICVQGNEKFQVLSISMPSENVVALHCVDGDGDTVQLTGHMHAVTFSFRVKKTTVPIPRRPIGFDMPS